MKIGSEGCCTNLNANTLKSITFSDDAFDAEFF